MLNIREFEKTLNLQGVDRYDYNLLCEKYAEYFRDNAQPGDGVTLCFYSDAEAYTIIKRTAKTLTIQRDKATLSPDFKPEFIPGGFCGTVVNQHEQTYTYEPDPNGSVRIARWSEKKKGFYWHDLHVTPGRHEFYDYNF